MLPDKIDWNAVSAVANVFTALGLVFALWQVRTTKNIAQLQFEDGLAREYRELASRIPTKAFLNVNLSDAQYKEAFDEFYRYVDLSNEQVSLRQRGRIGEQVWGSWRAGIEGNLGLPAFARAWEEIKSRTESFRELRRLEREGFKSDPKRWKGAV